MNPTRTGIRCLSVLALALLAACSGPPPIPGAGLAPEAAAAERARWYNEAKLGLFIHWGLYAVPARALPGTLAEWVMDNEKIPVQEYERFAERFTAARFDPAAWVALAKETGCRYIVLTSKHHDGFCLWDAQGTDYTAARFAAARRDLLRELGDACERGGVKLCAYYSMLDWHHPDFEGDFPKYVDWMHGQLRELLTGYPLWGLWFDGEWTHPKDAWRGDAIVAMIRALRPLAFVNDRLGRETRGTVAGVDFYTKEQEIPAEALRQAGRPVAWETCQTFGYSWGYNESPDPLKSGERIVEQLVDVVSKGGNFLLNVGPRPDGSIPEPLVERMKVIGAWMKANGEAVYGTTRSPFGGPLPAGRVTAKGSRLYVFLETLPAEGIVLTGLANRVVKAWVLDGGEALAVTVKEGTPVVAAPKKLTDPSTFTVVAVELDGPPALK
jgi:alpha-L-fucosidase